MQYPEQVHNDEYQGGGNYTIPQCTSNVLTPTIRLRNRVESLAVRWQDLRQSDSAKQSILCLTMQSGVWALGWGNRENCCA